ncbi:MAG: hypothetical protein JSS19_17285 [Proteobacteria bacterium]|nr:hypothetical protein [Pseudomonadota bacterium]
MAGPLKTPPRFVPTLTDVVHLPDEGKTGVAPAPSAPAMAHEPLQSNPMVPPTSQSRDGVRAEEPPHGLEEDLVHRVMQRVDVALDQRLREAIAQVVQEQTRFLVPRLREEVESVLRHAVYEAVAQELAGDGEGH